MSANFNNRPLITAPTLGTFFAFFLAVFASSPAFADYTIGGILCNVVTAQVYGIGNAVATIGVIALGIGAVLGKVSWGMAVTVAVGIGALYGASSIVFQVSNGYLNGC